MNWVCKSCKSKLAFVEGDILRVKYKDLYVFVTSLTGASLVRVLCRKCGTLNELILDSRNVKAPQVDVQQLKDIIGESAAELK